MDFWGVLTTSTAPWWYVGLLTGVLGITGIVSGAVVSYKSVKASDIRRNTFELDRIAAANDREDQRRWDMQVRQLCAKLIRMSSEVVVFAARRGQPITQQMIPIYNAFEKIEMSEDQRSEVKAMIEEYTKTKGFKKLWTADLGRIDKLNELTATYFEIELLAPSAIVEAANEFVELMWLQSNAGVFGDDYEAVQKKFARVVRNELGVMR